MAPGESTRIESRDPAVELVRRQTVLTLATVGESGPWSAPVYYVWLEGAFYFFSSPRSRHVRQALHSGKAAASIFIPADTWQAIRGVQMSGKVGQVRSPALSLKVIAAYLKQYPFTRSFFPENTAPDLDAFFKTFRAQLFKFTPVQVFYIDNRNGLGARQEIEW